MLATHEARRAGYDEAILLTEDGYIADGPGETIFVVKDGTVLHARPERVDPARDHPRLDHPDRPGHRLPVVQKPLIRTDLYLADEVFMTGTAVEVTPVRSVDDHEIGVGAGHARAPGGLHGHGRGPERALGPVARLRARA